MWVRPPSPSSSRARKGGLRRGQPSEGPPVSDDALWWHRKCLLGTGLRHLVTTSCNKTPVCLLFPWHNIHQLLFNEELVTYVPGKYSLFAETKTRRRVSWKRDVYPVD